MFSWLELQRLEPGAVDLRRYSVHIAISLSLVFSLTAIALLSKQNLTHELWADAAAVAIPMPIALYFRSRIVLLGVFTHVVFLIVTLGAAVLFGVPRLSHWERPTRTSASGKGRSNGKS